MGSGPDINYPAQPTYGEGLAEALKAQADFLKGTGDFAETGSLESLLPLEESVEKTAQTDTDVLDEHCWVLRQRPKSYVIRRPESLAYRTVRLCRVVGLLWSVSNDTWRGWIYGNHGYLNWRHFKRRANFEKLGYIEPTGEMSKWDRKMDGMDATEFKEYRLTAKDRKQGSN